MHDTTNNLVSAEPGQSLDDKTPVSVINTQLNNSAEKEHSSPRMHSMIALNAINEYVDNISLDIDNMTNVAIAKKVVNHINCKLEEENVRTNNQKGPYRLKPITRLEFFHLAELMQRLHAIINIAPSGNYDRNRDMLAIYDPNPTSPDYGTYQASEKILRRTARQYCPDITIKEFNNLYRRLSINSPRKVRHQQRDMIPVNNGIFNYETKQLQEFSPEYVFLAKAAVAYNPMAVNPSITHPEDGTVWDVESWMCELSDDPEIVNVLWEIIGAIVRPYVSWNKSAWFFSEKNKSGKSTLIELMRQILGEDSYASIQLSEFSKNLHLKPLTSAQAILVDDDYQDAILEKTDNLIKVITHSVIPIRQGSKSVIGYQFYGFMVQCLDGFPKVKEQSKSFFRNQIFIPFNKDLTSSERRYIKDDYIQRQDVLEYVLHRVLHMNYYDLSTPQASVNVLDEYKNFVDPVRDYWAEFKDEFTWDLLPNTFLYDHYKAWFERTAPSGPPLGRNTFVKKLVAIATEGGEWEKIAAPQRPGGDMSRPEPIVIDYDLTAWQNQAVAKNSTARSIPRPLKATYRGLIRKEKTSVQH